VHQIATLPRPRTNIRTAHDTVPTARQQGLGSAPDGREAATHRHSGAARAGGEHQLGVLGRSARKRHSTVPHLAKSSVTRVHSNTGRKTSLRKEGEVALFPLMSYHNEHPGACFFRHDYLSDLSPMIRRDVNRAMPQGWICTLSTSPVPARLSASGKHSIGSCSVNSGLTSTAPACSRAVAWWKV